MKSLTYRIIQTLLVISIKWASSGLASYPPMDKQTSVVIISKMFNIMSNAMRFAPWAICFILLVV